jgi:carboxyl-terminal processing protease
MRLGLSIFILAALSVQPVWAAPNCPSPEPTTEAERIFALSKIWHIADRDFAWFHQVPDLDWDAEYLRHIPMVRDAQTELDYYRALQSFITTLQDGHTNLTLSPSLVRGCVWDAAPLRLTPLGENIYVTDVDRDWVDQIPLGSRVITVDGLDIEKKIKRDVLPYLATSSPHTRRELSASGWSHRSLGPLFGPVGTAARIGIITPDGDTRVIPMIRNRFRDGGIDWVKQNIDPAGEGSVHLSWDGDIAILSLNSFSDETVPEQFDALLPDLRRAKGLVIDISRNGGGSTTIGGHVLQRFIDRPAPGSRWMTPKYVSAFKVWGEGGLEEYAEWADPMWETGEHDTLAPLGDADRMIVPIVIITSKRTGSAAEDFMVFAKSQPHIVQMGEPTAGTTGQPVHFDLPGGFRARVSAKRDTMPDGTDFVGTGVVPDIEVTRSLDDVLNNHNPALITAIANVRSRID